MKVTKAQIEDIVSRPYGVEVVYGEDPSEGVLARVAEWPGCLSAGDTREEALERIGEAMRDWVAYRLEHGLGIPEPITSYGGKVLVQMPKSLHRDVMKRAEREGVSMNQLISTTLARAMGFVDAIGPARVSRRRVTARRAVRGARRSMARKRRKGR